MSSAFNDCNRAIELDPSYFYAYNNRGIALEKMGRVKEALSNFETALRLHPGFKVASENYERLNGSIGGIRPPERTSGQTIISLESRGGTLVVPISINGEITLKFTVDSGAADVMIPADVVSTLFRTGSLTRADFIGEQTYELADGSTIPSETFNIRYLRIGDKVVKDVKGSVAPAAGNLLLGQSFLSRFSSWSIDNKRRMLILN